MAFGRVFRVTLNGSVFGNLMQNVLHFKVSDTLANDPQAIANEMLVGWVTLIKTAHSSDMKYNGCTVQEMVRPLTVQTTVNWPPVSGTLSGDGGPLQCALLISLTTNLAGKSHRGRIYIAGIQSAATSQGRFTTSAQNNYTSVLNNIKARYLVTGINNQGLQIVVFSRKKWDAGQPALDCTTEVTNMTYHAVPATQRRRRLGHGV